MISYLGSLVQFSPGAGRAGRCRQLSLCVGSTGRVLAEQPEAWFGALSKGAPRPLPPRPQRAPLVGSQEVFRQEPGPVCRVGGGGFSGAEFAPCPPPPTSSGDGAALLWSFSVPLFCEPPAVCSGRSIFLSLSHSLKKSPSNCSQGLLPGPYPKQCPRKTYLMTFDMPAEVKSQLLQPLMTEGLPNDVLKMI